MPLTGETVHVPSSRDLCGHLGATTDCSRGRGVWQWGWGETTGGQLEGPSWSRSISVHREPVTWTLLCPPLSPPPIWYLRDGLPNSSGIDPGPTLLPALLRSSSCAQGCLRVSCGAGDVSLISLDCPSAEHSLPGLGAPRGPTVTAQRGF